MSVLDQRPARALGAAAEHGRRLRLLSLVAIDPGLAGA